MATQSLGYSCLEEERANGAEIDDAAISGVKVGMMGPLAGAGDPLFWFTLRPIFLSLGAGLAVSGNVLGPIVFFVLWNVMVAAVKWYTQEFGYPCWYCDYRRLVR